MKWFKNMPVQFIKLYCTAFNEEEEEEEDGGGGSGGHDESFIYGPGVTWVV